MLLGDGGPGPALLDDIVVKDPELFVRVVQLLAQEPDPRPGVR
ncbi:hypothetical protein [Kitasatospora sp. MBT63]|nr:hypothetical protein [Kitasatospora sp. MBT63]